MAQRSTSRSTSDEPLVVAQILGPHGVRGDVRVDPRTDVAGRFKKGAVLRCDGVGELTIVSRRGTSDSPILRFEGIDTREKAEELRGRFLRVARDESRRATKGAYLWADLVGAAVTSEGGELLGTVRDLIRAGENDVLIVVDGSGRERLLPVLESVIRDVDLEGARIVVRPQDEAS